MSTFTAVDAGRQEMESWLADVRTTQQVACATLVMTNSIDEKIALSLQVQTLARSARALGAREERLAALPGYPEAGPNTHPGSNHFSPLRIRSCYAVSVDWLQTVLYPELVAQGVNARERAVLRGDTESIRCYTDCIELLRTIVDLESTSDVPRATQPGVWHGATAPFDIPARPGRPPGCYEAERREGTLSIAEQLHDFAFRIELCAAEACASMIATSPNAPLGLHIDLAMQIADEVRHFQLFMNRVRESGLRPESFGIRFEVWDKFRSGRSLPEQLIIEQRIGEGAALDTAHDVHLRLLRSGDAQLAAQFEYVTADEVQHVKAGNCWLLDLLGTEDAVIVAESSARQLLASRGFSQPIRMPSRELRIPAGFTEREIRELEIVHLKSLTE